MGRAAPGDEVWGPLLRGKFGDRADDIAMAWLWSKLRLRRRSRARRRARSGSATRGGSWEPLFDALRARIEARGGRVLIDRPGRAARADSRQLRASPPARRARSGAGTTRARSTPPASPSATTRVLATVPNDVFAELLDPARGEIGADYLGRLRGDRVLHRALPAARARPRVQPLLLDQRRRPRAAVRRADRAHQLHRARALRRPPLPLRRQLPRARRTSCSASTPTRCSSATRPACARSTRLRPLVGQGALAAPRARRAADRHRRLPRRASRRCRRRRRRASCSPTRRRSIPRTGAPTTPCGWATTPPRRCSRAAPRESPHTHSPAPSSGSGSSRRAGTGGPLVRYIDVATAFSVGPDRLLKRRRA